MAIVSGAGGLTPSSLETTIWLVVAIAILFTLFRFTIRLYALRKLLADDVAVAAALLLLISLAIMYEYATPKMFEVVRVAQGEEAFTLPFMDRATVFLKLQFAIIVLFWTEIWVVKVSFLIFYRNVFSGLPELMLGWRLVAVFTGLTYALCWAFQLASCIPIPNYFILGACETRRDIYYSNANLYVAAVGDIVSDLMIMALGLRLLSKLQMRRNEKLALGAIFSVGFIKIVFAVVRVVKIGVSATHVNPIWLALWTMIEASVAIVVACLPSFRVLFAHGRRRSELRHAVTLKVFRKRHSPSHNGDTSHPLPLEEGNQSSRTQDRGGDTEDLYWHDAQMDEELIASDLRR
ncbi:MAG: hypothetical protein Q9208_000744 [Pyrenodesmia sp. 3 TL-2023]